MSDTTNTQVQGTVATSGEATEVQAEETTKFFATREECEANKPKDVGKKQVYGVSKDGKTRWLWAAGYVNAIDAAARADGYMVSKGNKKEVTKEAVAAKLAEFTDDELAAMGLSRRKTKGK